MRNTFWLIGLIAAVVWGLTSNTSPPLKMVVITFWIFFVVKFLAVQRTHKRPSQGLRLVIQLFCFDAQPYLRNWFLTIGYHALTTVFVWQTLVYGYAALAGL